MKKLIAVSFSGIILLFGMRCFNDLSSDPKKANDVKIMSYFGLLNECGQTDGSSGYIRFRLDGQDLSIMNCKAEHITFHYTNNYDYWVVRGRCKEIEILIYIGDGAVGDHNQSAWLPIGEFISYYKYNPDGSFEPWYGLDGGISIINVTLHDDNSIKGAFSGSICMLGQCRNVTNGEFSSVGVKIYY